MTLIRLSLLALCLTFLAACGDKPSGDTITIHEAYSQLVGTKAFPEEINSRVATILQETNKFGVSEYIDVETIVTKYCHGNDFSPWQHFVSMLPLRVMDFFAPESMFIAGNIQLLIVKQIERASQCVNQSNESDINE